MARFPEWNVFWRGLPATSIAPAIDYALAQSSDFETPPRPASNGEVALEKAPG
jgi:hypothetical protein